MTAGDTKIVYVSSSNLTITLASLASDTSLVAGRESTIVDNTTNLYIDYLLSGFICSGTSPTTGQAIEVWVYGTLDSAYDLPDGITGSDSNRTLTSINTKGSGLRSAAVITVTSTSNVKYPIAPTSIASLFGGRMPQKFGVYVVHNTAVALNATGGNHQITITPIYYNTSAS